MANAVANADTDGDNQLDPGELEEMLRKTKLAGHFTVKRRLLQNPRAHHPCPGRPLS